ncbi:MAG: hypothetical protein BIP78_0441 [Candidatus Bipolaricaulis sibiricus]|uniref:Uncharacterized protein n=1 Tax=Bipolaricaulis sibiricus TaxID=2501609 RepID=A0A410FT11_BIPS1|nr:MAG: hypothetical protein BIP78_0441 [Candidatus Bipolaricaulis sibiricus]
MEGDRARHGTTSLFSYLLQGDRHLLGHATAKSEGNAIRGFRGRQPVSLGTVRNPSGANQARETPEGLLSAGPPALAPLASVGPHRDL